KMFEKCLIFIFLSLARLNAATLLLSLGAKDFQLDFLREVTDFAEQRAEQSLNDYLTQLEHNPKNENYTKDLKDARSSQNFQTKMTLVKQLLDAEHHLDADLEHTSVLRSLIFLNRLKSTLRAARDASAQEIRQLRLHRLCQQFQRPVPLSRSRYINEQTIGAALEQVHLTRGSDANTTDTDLSQFGLQLYEKVKVSGAEIINNYLQILRGLIQDIMDGDHADLANSSSRLRNVLNHLDTMLTTQDFFEKRQKVYAYLKRHLDTDYEQLQESSNPEHHLTEQLMAKLQAKGLDLFVIFLFSNFEFLELVHMHWSQMLPQLPNLLYDGTSRQLYDVQQLYENFILDTESEAKYQAYSDSLRRLHERTMEEGERSHHIFELLSNAAQNVGSVTFNMIKAKCQELI
ncbi:hypothetical protein KR074_001522, partial [Drosophila pseudoananassae]